MFDYKDEDKKNKINLAMELFWSESLNKKH
jgi:hypothetical protein